MSNINNISGFASVISLNDLKILINLGVSKKERSKEQEVNISFKFFFLDKPEGCVTDNIKDTICYHQISDIINNFCKEKEFNLLERLCISLFNTIRPEIHESVKIWIQIEKCNPPIKNLNGTTSFEYTDLWQTK